MAFRSEFWKHPRGPHKSQFCAWKIFFLKFFLYKIDDNSGIFGSWDYFLSCSDCSDCCLQHPRKISETSGICLQRQCDTVTYVRERTKIVRRGPSSSDGGENGAPHKMYNSFRIVFSSLLRPFGLSYITNVITKTVTYSSSSLKIRKMTSAKL